MSRLTDRLLNSRRLNANDKRYRQSFSLLPMFAVFIIIPIPEIQGEKMRNLYTELAEYTGRDQKLVEARSIHANVELAWQFEKHKDNPIEHYRKTDLYLFASTRYQMDLQFHGVHDWYKSKIKKYG